MAVKVMIPTPLRAYAGKRDSAEFKAEERQFPQLKEALAFIKSYAKTALRFGWKVLIEE